MVRGRVKSLYCLSQENGDIYRALHVDKSIIQREILNQLVKQFVFPLPPAPQAQPVAHH